MHFTSCRSAGKRLPAERRVAVIISLRNNFPMAEGEKHRDERLHLAVRRKAHHGNGEDADPFQFNGQLIARFDNPPHRVALRPKKLTTFFIRGAQVRAATDAAFGCDAIGGSLHRDCKKRRRPRMDPPKLPRVDIHGPERCSRRSSLMIPFADQKPGAGMLAIWFLSESLSSVVVPRSGLVGALNPS